MLNRTSYGLRVSPVRNQNNGGFSNIQGLVADSNIMIHSVCKTKLNMSRHTMRETSLFFGEKGETIWKVNVDGITKQLIGYIYYNPLLLLTPAEAPHA
jgi:hypothetical protein